MSAEADVFAITDPAVGSPVDTSPAPVADVVVLDGVVDMASPLTTDEAQELTEHIRSTADVLYVLLGRAHAGKAWQALGYNSFAEYVGSEFDMSRSRAYQILNQHKVIAALEEAMPEGSTLSISEATARDLKSVIDDIVPEVKKATAGLTVDEAQSLTEELVEDYRQQVREAQQAPSGADDQDEDYRPSGGLPGQFGGGNGGGYQDFDSDPDFGDDGPELDGPDYDPREIRMRVQAAYELFTSLAALKTMPDPMVVLEAINEDRVPQVNEQLPGVVQWLTDFQKVWQQRHPSDPADEEDV